MSVIKINIVEKLTEEVEHKKCPRCKSYSTLDKFLNNKGRKLKTCQKCRDRDKKQREKYKCIHDKQKSRCRECGGGAFCIHDKIKNTCRECGGVSFCIHDKFKYDCRECDGSAFCIHDKFKKNCRECGGSAFCIHDKFKYDCRECGGGAFCIHDKFKYDCRECGGSAFCIHDKYKSRCRECGGSSFCIHDKTKSNCRECGGGAFCIHDKFKRICRECDPIGYLSGITRSRIRSALKSNKSKHSIEYLGCDIQHFKEHIENQFKEGMNWENHGEWHIDHIVPLKYDNPTIEEVMIRCHYLNTQPLWAEENISKGNRYIG